MTRLDFKNSPSLYLEIGQSSLKALYGNDGMELTIERMANGRLTEACKERLSLGLREFLQKKNWQSSMGAFCAVKARGVSLRRMTLPETPKNGVAGMLRLQIEREFPLSPEELAWGYSALDERGRSANVPAGQQEMVVAAVKKEALEEYAELLAGCGVSPVFTLAALARGFLCPTTSGTYAMLDIGRNQSELISYENGAPMSLRIIPWGGEDLTRAIREKLNISHDEAEKLKIGLDREPASTGELGRLVQEAVSGAVNVLATALKSNWNGHKLYLAGKTSRQKDFAAQLGRALGGRVDCEQLNVPPGEGRSAAILGLKQAREQEGGREMLVIQLGETREVARLAQARPDLRKLAVTAALLLIAVIAFPYLEALLLKPRLEKKLAEIEDAKDRLAAIDQELGFLQYLRLNQPPYLDAAYIMANAAPGGTKFDSLSMNHQGEVSFRGIFMGAQQVADFRSKLIKSGFFSVVSVEEQAPTPDRQRMNVRMTALWKPASARQSLVIGPSTEEIEKAKKAKEAEQGGGGMNGGLPPGMSLPPGVTLPPGFVFPGGGDE